MPNQYEVLGKAPGVKDLQNLSPSNVHLTIKISMLVMEKWKFSTISIFV